MPRRRLGVVLLVPQPEAAEVDGLRLALGEADRVRVAPHITLVPPINVREEAVGEAIARVEKAVVAMDPLTVTLGPVANFAPVTPVVYLAVGPQQVVDELEGLRERLDVPPLQRTTAHPFVPHVTLNEEVGPDRIEAACSALADWSAQVEIGRIDVLEERRDPEGRRRWRSIADRRFGPVAMVGRGGLEDEIVVAAGIDPGSAPLLANPRDPWAAPRRPGSDVVVAIRRAGETVGLVVARRRGPEAIQIDELEVASQVRGTGVGRRLLATLEDEARAMGVRRLVVDAPAGRVPRRWLRARGWLAPPNDGMERRL